MSEYVETGLGAARWAWELLWQPGQASHAKVRLLDALFFTKEGGLSGWLFTSLSDGLVKSKSQQNWTAAKVNERCGTRVGEDGTLVTPPKAHVTVIGNRKGDWKALNPSRVLGLVSGGAEGAIVSFAHLTGSVSFVEVSYEAQNCHPLIKCITHSLYNGSTLIEENHRKGMNYPLHSKAANVPLPRPGDPVEPGDEVGLPQHRQVCLSKEISASTKTFIVDLIRQRSGNIRLHLRVRFASIT